MISRMHTNRLSTLLISPLLLSSLLFSSLLFLGGCKGDQNPITANEQPSFHAAEYSQESYDKKHLISAFVNTVDQANIGFQTSGRLAKQLIQIGDHVEKGAPLLTLYNPQLEPQIADIKARVEANDAASNQVQLELDRNKSLEKIQAVSANRIDQLSNQLKQLQAENKSLQAQLATAENMFKETTLSAPFAGEVADILKKPGTMVSAGEPVLQLNGADLLEAPVYLPAKLIKGIQKNDAVTVIHRNIEMIGTIKEISRSAQPNSQLYKILVELPQNSDLQAGEKIEVTLLEPIRNIYKLPLSSVIDNGINEPYIFTIIDQTVIPKRIQIIDFYNDSVLLDIINEKQTLTVVTLGQSALSPQQKLTQP